jgi:type I restriction enzyme R subunit
VLPHERALEDEVTAHLAANGYNAVKWGNRDPRDFDPVRALDATELTVFLEATQPDEWTQLKKLHGGTPASALTAFLDRLTQELDKRGTVDVLRHGVIDLGVTVKLAYFKPAHGLTEELVRRYKANRVTVMRQFAYSADDNKTIDIALVLNGIPVATAELKNPMTGQGVEQAIDQYRRDRDPKNITLAKRALVHFAVDPDRVAMTTKLAGTSDALPALQPWPRPGRRQPAKPQRAPQRLSVGACLAARQLA